jgi:hypothetical protein
MKAWNVGVKAAKESPADDFRLQRKRRQDFQRLKMWPGYLDALWRLLALRRSDDPTERAETRETCL